MTDYVKRLMDALRSHMPIRRGTWQPKCVAGGVYVYVCNRCAYDAVVPHEYCPQCGAKMRVEWPTLGVTTE